MERVLYALRLLVSGNSPEKNKKMYIINNAPYLFRRNVTK
jgi:hypothetical protein